MRLGECARMRPSGARQRWVAWYHAPRFGWLGTEGRLKSVIEVAYQYRD
jgi:hypothetical protein